MCAFEPYMTPTKVEIMFERRMDPESEEEMDKEMLGVSEKVYFEGLTEN